MNMIGSVVGDTLRAVEAQSNLDRPLLVAMVCAQLVLVALLGQRVVIPETSQPRSAREKGD
ncbi:hypothetical protein [Mycolicibacterium houstonense]|uniref:hypothetical protein n=1 Tax=Mycolicibacterium houstonense TaxID=146021 RepID=UPI000A3FFBC4|nr:hypothetical protein [Mycolicibacterium houstonense]